MFVNVYYSRFLTRTKFESSSFGHLIGHRIINAAERCLHALEVLEEEPRSALQTIEFNANTRIINL